MLPVTADDEQRTVGDRASAGEDVTQASATVPFPREAFQDERLHVGGVPLPDRSGRETEQEPVDRAHVRSSRDV